MSLNNRPTANISTYRIQKSIRKIENLGFALKLTFSNKESKEEFVKMTFCQMLYYTGEKVASFKSSELFHTPKVVHEYGGTILENEIYLKIPRPGKNYVTEVAYNFFDSWGNLVCTHNQTI